MDERSCYEAQFHKDVFHLINFLELFEYPINETAWMDQNRRPFRSEILDFYKYKN